MSCPWLDHACEYKNAVNAKKVGAAGGGLKKLWMLKPATAAACGVQRFFGAMWSTATHCHAPTTQILPRLPLTGSPGKLLSICHTLIASDSLLCNHYVMLLSGINTYNYSLHRVLICSNDSRRLRCWTVQDRSPESRKRNDRILPDRTQRAQQLSRGV